MDLLKIPRLVAILTSLTLCHCISSGGYRPANITTIELNKGNFSVLATRVSGTSSSGYLIGFVVPSEINNVAISVTRISGSNTNKKDAIKNLWENFEKEHGAAKGRKLGLVNVNYDVEAANWFGIYASETLTVSADVIEFTGN